MKSGEDYYDSQEFLDMLAEYEKSVNTGQPVYLDADELSEIADFYQMNGQADEAEAAIRLALSLSPGAFAPLSYRIHEALYNGDVEAAKDFLAQIKETDDPDYIYCKAEILMSDNKVEEADLLLRDYFKTIPPDEYQDYVVDVAGIYQDNGFSEKAMEWLNRSKPENTPDFKELLAHTLFGLGKYKDSEKLFNELIDTDPYQKRYWNALASAQFMNEDYSGSVQSSEYAIAIDPEDAEGLISKANGLYRLNNFEEALKYFRRYSEQEPDDEFAYLHQGTCLINLNRNKEAIDILTKALETVRKFTEENPEDVSPYLPDIYQELSFAYSETGDVDMALDCLEKTDALECDHSGINVIKGHILLSAGRLDEAGRYFRKAVVESDDAPQTLLRVIVSLYDNKYVDDAYKMFLKFFMIVSTDFTDGYAYMALCCYELEKYDEFLHYLKKACELNPKESRLVLSHLFPEDLPPEKYYDYIKNKMK